MNDEDEVKDVEPRYYDMRLVYEDWSDLRTPPLEVKTDSATNAMPVADEPTMKTILLDSLLQPPAFWRFSGGVVAIHVENPKLHLVLRESALIHYECMEVE